MANAPGTVSFNVDAARQAGYSDADIANAIGQKAGFNTDAARQAGYSDQEIITHLTQAQPLIAKPAAPTAAPAPTPSVASDAVSGFLQPFKTLGSDVAADYHRVMTQRPPSSLQDAGRQLVSSLAGPARMVGDVAALTGAPVQAVVRPAADRISRLPVQAYAPSSLNVGPSGVSVTGPRPMTQPQTQAAVEGALNTALSGARPELPTGMPLARPVPVTTPPTVDAIAAAKNAAYKAVDDSGVHYTPRAFKGLTEDIASRMDDAGFNAGLHPKAAAMMRRIGQSLDDTPDYSPTLTQLDQLRQQIGRDVASSSDAGDRRMGQIMRGAIDDFIDSPPPGSVVGGDPATASDLISQARDLNTRLMKLNKLDGLDEAASDRAAGTGSGGNVNNATRQNLIRFKNQVNNLTPDEQAAVQKVIDGTPLGNALRQIGKLSPQGNGLMLAGQLAAAVPTHGLSGAAALAGYGAKIGADAITARNVDALRSLIANGGVTPGSPAMTGRYYLPGGAPPVSDRVPFYSMPGAIGANAVLRPLTRGLGSAQMPPPAPAQAR